MNKAAPALTGIRAIPTLLLLTLLPLAIVAQEADTSSAAIVGVASKYVAEYQQVLTSVLADEALEQEVVRRMPVDPDAKRLRRMVSEVFFMFTPGTNEWMAIRDIIAVDGRPIADRPNIRSDLGRLGEQEVARSLKTQNSRFNIGRVTRNFSEPTLCLLVLDPRHTGRFKFDRRRVEKDADTTLVRLAFTETESPTLISDAMQGSIFSTGEIVVEASSGRVRETTLRARSGDIKVELVTEYAAEHRLGMWVPVSFRESYEGGADRKTLDGDAVYEHVIASAIYTNYRRFQTSTRIK